ncbi:MAG: hypothetical protein SCM11_16120 [Bacillota bacterium]|nr:hypothetical protein [Bacillota bacterium]
MIDIFGRVKQVYTMKHQSGDTVLVLATLRFANKAIANIELVCGFQGIPYEKGEFCGTEGIVKYDTRFQSPFVHVSGENEKSADNNYLLAKSEPFISMVTDLFACSRVPDCNLQGLEKHKYLSIVMSAIEASTCRNCAVTVCGGEEDAK